ncbi:MAG: ABC-ATPase domain-containing protein [Candidatus Eisenbacteria bacterium]|nr:ABC-ATPase domain-containing protein [Candidatus Eisenbacteria bacterium]
MSARREDDLRELLRRIDGAGYGAYREIHGRYAFADFELLIDHVQGDPFAAPSRLRVLVPQSAARFPEKTRRGKSRSIALASFLACAFADAARRVRGRRGSGKSGLIEIDRPGQEVLERTAVLVDDRFVEARFAAGLPAVGRRILGREAEAMLLDELPEIVRSSLFYASSDLAAIERAVLANEDTDFLRAALDSMGLVAFVAEGSILPRRSGVDDRPLAERAIPFESPPSLRASFDLPNGGRVTGMGIPRGVTLVVGGGFHGKSTLLAAIERGVYNHIPGDGRELVVTDPTAVKIRAEDGRRVEGVDITPFIGDLPFGARTDFFSSDNASGSTSQAANIIEALEAGARVLLIDEDTAATNFMIRDRRMRQLVAKEKEPITPFVDKVRILYEEKGVSTILVAGGSGDYFDVADTVIWMNDYLPVDATADAKAIAARHRGERMSEEESRFGNVAARVPLPESIDPSRGRREVSIRVRGRRAVQFGKETLDLSAVSQIVDASQTRAIAEAILYARGKWMNGRRSLKEILDALEAELAESGLDALSARRAGDLAAFRPLELAAALNRLRSLRVKRP